MDEFAKSHCVLVTGVTGQLGRHVLGEIAAWPNTKVVALVRAKSKSDGIPANVRSASADFSDADALSAILETYQPSVVIHCAATGMLLPHPGWAELIRFNVNVSALLCELTSRIPGSHFVHVSTGLAYRDQGRALREIDPLDSEHPYAASKIAAESLVRAVAAECRLPLTIIRPFSFSGVGDRGSRLFPSLLRAAEDQKPFSLSPGDHVRDYCAVNDIAHGIALAVACRHELPADTQVFNLGGGCVATLRQLVTRVVEELDLQVTLNFGARSNAPRDPTFSVADTARSRSLLGWRPQINFAYAVWELAQASFPKLQLKQPNRTP